MRSPRILDPLARARQRLPWPLRPRPGRILAVKWGLNPNSSSLGVDVTFLLFGAAALSLATPLVSALLRLRRPAADPHRAAGDPSRPAEAVEHAAT